MSVPGDVKIIKLEFLSLQSVGIEENVNHLSKLMSVITKTGPETKAACRSFLCEVITRKK